MRPVLLELAFGGTSVALRAYSTFYALAWLTAPAIAAWAAARAGLSGRRALAVYGLALAAGVVGGRALDLFVAWGLYADDPRRILGLGFTGYSLYGGFVLATFAGIGVARRARLPVWRLADTAVPGLAAGVVLMRVGCFLNGCCFGTPTSLPWAVTYPAGSIAWRHQLVSGTSGVLGTLVSGVEPVHPTQLYEIAAVLAAAGLAALASRVWRAEGVGFLAFALAFTLARLGNGFLRARVNTITAPEWFYPAFYAVLACVIAALLVWRAATPRRSA